MMCFQFVIGKNLNRWDHFSQLPIAARISGALSYTLGEHYYLRPHDWLYA
jgi:hypothetical protein